MSLRLVGKPARAARERAVGLLLFLTAALSVAITAAIIWSLFSEAINFFRDPAVTVAEFFTGTRWTPQFAEKHFGIWPLVNGTLMVTAGSALVALPLGVLSALYLSEFASPRTRSLLKPLLEILFGIPTVVYGYFALTFVTPLLRQFIPGISIFNALSASLVMGVMILPMVSSLSEDALHAVPDALRQGAYALGATRWEVASRVVVPAALSGVLASFILGISRALGETMLVTIAAGQLAQLTLDPRDPIMTMTAYIVNVSLGDTPYGSIEYRSIFAVGLVLFLITLGVNVLSNWIVARYREVYQ